MAVIEITQYKEVFHVPKETFREVIMYQDMSKTELRVFCYLLTNLDGFNLIRRLNGKKEVNDPLKFTNINISILSNNLAISEKKAKKAINRLLELGIIEKGDSTISSGGYRFTF